MTSYQPAWRRPIADLFRRTAHAAVAWCVRRRIHPNTVSYSSVVASSGAAVCFWQSGAHPELLLAAVGLCYLRLWLNMLDGMVALASNTASRTGEIANEFPDRISDVVIFVGVGHSGLCHPLGGYWVAIFALLVAYVGTLGQAVGARREFGGVMSKPWRMVALNVGAWVTLGRIWAGDDIHLGGLSILDWTHGLIIVGCLQTLIVRLARTVRFLNSGGNRPMSPVEALQNPVALFHGALAYGLLFIGGVTLFTLKRRGWNVGQAWQAYRGWLVMIPLTATAIFLGREVSILFFTAVAVAGFREFARATRLDDAYLSACAQVGILALGGIALIPGRLDLFQTLPLLAIAALLTIPVLRDRAEGQLRFLSLAILGVALFGCFFGHVCQLANAREAYSFLIYLLLAVECNDVAAYLGGKALGRRPLCTTLSPKKTIEGAIVALLVSLALPWALWFTFPQLLPVDLLAIGLIIGVGGQVGDLAVSVLKRDLGVKDIAATIPGHGGILDRIDSLTFVAPFFFHYLRLRGELAPFA